jgi:SAM-dependent methyltransferase
MGGGWSPPAAIFPSGFSMQSTILSADPVGACDVAAETGRPAAGRFDPARAGLLCAPSGGSAGGGAAGNAGGVGGSGDGGGRDDDDDAADGPPSLFVQGDGRQAPRGGTVRSPRNYYDNPDFYNGYVGMRHETPSANDHIERPYLEKVLPDVSGKRVLDLGCGTGEYVVNYLLKAAAVDAVDLSTNMLSHLQARIKELGLQHVRAIHASIEAFDFPVDHYDLVLSMLAFHYIKDLAPVFGAVARSLQTGGTFIFNVEHPIYTAAKLQGWAAEGDTGDAHWRMDDYFERGLRRALWFDVEIERYHRTVEDYFDLLIDNGFQVTRMLEPEPGEEARRLDPELDRHHRRPPFLMFVARKG